MALDDLFDAGDLLMFRRFYVGLAITAAVCWGVYTLVPNGTVAWIVIVPIALVGLWLSLRWEHQSDSRR